LQALLLLLLLLQDLPACSAQTGGVPHVASATFAGVAIASSAQHASHQPLLLPRSAQEGVQAVLGLLLLLRVMTGAAGMTHGHGSQ
jgi:hypothetical protein